MSRMVSQPQLEHLLQTLEEVRLSDPQEVLRLAQQIYRLALEAENWSAASKSQYELSFAYTRMGRYPEAVLPAQNALIIAQTHGLRIEEGYGLNAIGALHGYTGNYTEALEYFMKQRQVALETQHKPLLDLALRSIGFVYLETEEFAKAIDIYQEQLQQSDESQLRGRKALMVQNIGVAYHRMDDLPRALEYYVEALALAEKYNVADVKMYALASMVSCKSQLQQLDDAQHALEKLEQYCQQHGNAQQTIVTAARARLYLSRQQFPEAIQEYQQALELARQTNNQQSLTITLSELVEVYRDSGDFKSAFYYSVEFHKAKAVLVSENSRVRHDILSAIHQLQQLQQEAEIQRLRSENAEHKLAEMQRTEAERLEKERLQYVLEQERRLAATKNHILERLHHEIRTPLAIIQTSTHILMHHRDRLSEEQRQQRVEKISDQFWKIGKLLDEIAAILTAAQHQFAASPRPVQVNALCQRAMETASRLVNAPDRIELSVHDLPDAVAVDEGLLEEILTHVLTNALKCSVEKVTAEIWAQDNTLIAQVTDKGIGIPGDELQHVFEPFFRASNNDELPGIGLGLKIVQDYVNVLGGKIRLDSELNHGTQVTVEIPLPPSG